MIEKYQDMLVEAKRNFKNAKDDCSTESMEYFRGKIIILEQILEDLF